MAKAKHTSGNWAWDTSSKTKDSQAAKENKIQAMLYVDVILPLPLDGVYTYSLPPAFAPQVSVGSRVVVPLGKSKRYIAVVYRIHETAPDFPIKPILTLLDAHPTVLPHQLSLWQWISQYYMCALGDVLTAALPAGLKQEDRYHAQTETYLRLPEQYQSERALHIALDLLKPARQQLHAFNTFLSISHWSDIDGTQQPQLVDISREELQNEAAVSPNIVKTLKDRGFLEFYEREIGRLNHSQEPHPERIKPLSSAQQEAYNQILLQHLRRDVVLLHGVTSSGKTEIYIHLIAHALQEHRQVLYLVPEIALTVQLMQRLQQVFGHRLGIYHSRYSDAERVEIWQKQLSAAPYDIILGARSAALLPFQRLGLVIIDEEHENSFKQQDPAPRYHARSVALMLAREQQAKVVLGTATPSAETYYNATVAKKYGYVRLSTRYQDIALPRIEVVDVRDLQRRKIMRGPLSPQLIEAIRTALEQGKQAILFQNRRGFAPMIECKVCGWVPRCKNCDVPLTYHKRLNLLTCHYCGAAYAVPAECPSCEEHQLRGRGIGTEKLEEIVAELFPTARIARMDLDTTRSRGAYQRIIDDFSSGRTNILIGTQMVTKGLDFANVSVVGIVSADEMMNQPDFRAFERAFQMMTQVSGRAGRKGQQGLVLLQTKNTESSVVQQVVADNQPAFFQSLLNEREMFCYPPFHRLIYIYLRHSKEPLVERAAARLADLLRAQFSTRILGPDKPSVGRVRQQHIRKIVLKLERTLPNQQVRKALLAAEKQLLQDHSLAALQVYYDVDP